MPPSPTRHCVALLSMLIKKKTGARGIMTVCENILRDFKFELPSTNIDELVITPAVCNNPQAELRKLLKKRAVSKMPLITTSVEG